MTIASHPPSWLKKRLLQDRALYETRTILSQTAAATVCESSLCPNLNECFSKRHVTFLMLGRICTRRCAFCSVSAGSAEPVDEGEPFRILEAAKRLASRHVIVTSVTRDDLADGGAGQFVRTISLLRGELPRVTIEVLIPDFAGETAPLEAVVNAKPDVIGHNLETVRRLYALVRPHADYERSLGLLRRVKKMSPEQTTKSAIMLGLGEVEEEVIAAMGDIKASGCEAIVIGQYLRPSPVNIAVETFVPPDKFQRYGAIAKGMGFRSVIAGPFARSSYLINNTAEVA